MYITKETPFSIKNLKCDGALKVPGVCRQRVRLLFIRIKKKPNQKPTPSKEPFFLKTKKQEQNTASDPAP